MPLVPGKLSADMIGFIEQVNKLKQEDAAKAIESYCKKLESTIYEAIKSITITIPPSAIIVVGSQTTQTNVIPIVLTDVIK